MNLLILLIVLSVLSFGSSFGFVSRLERRSGSGTTLQMTLLTYQGKKVEVKEGTPLSQACAKLGLKPKYDCKNGECGSCTISVGGTRMKACQAKVPPMPKLKSLQEKGLECK
mmetsp:Transcript_2231/g.3415  ORF Transcript_2231/g.3415 Transcript_2231/m.3415 type:complete len:112 (+) Transcript_2231:125-460(+)